MQKVMRPPRLIFSAWAWQISSLKIVLKWPKCYFRICHSSLLAKRCTREKIWGRKSLGVDILFLFPTPDNEHNEFWEGQSGTFEPDIECKIKPFC